GYPQTNRKIDTGKTLTRWPVFVDHFSYNYHGKHEFVILEGMEKAVQVIVRIAELTAQRK
uniref:hypothetical protein n=1 Tax=Shigella sp. FJ200713 TaxID=3156209 RepID=UPI003390D402